MALPATHGESASPIVDEEMGNNLLGTTDEDTIRMGEPVSGDSDRSSATVIEIEQSCEPTNQAAPEAGLPRIMSENSTRPPEGAGPVPESTSQGAAAGNEGRQILPLPPQNRARSLRPPLAQIAVAPSQVAPSQLKRGHDADDSDMPLTTIPQTRATSAAVDGGQIEEVDMYGIRTKVRVTTNEAEVRQRIQERDEVAAQRDTVAMERTFWKEKVEELQHSLQETATQKNGLEQQLIKATRDLTEANRKVAHLEGRIEAIKSHAQAQVEALKNRMMVATAEHAKIMKDWEDRRMVREQEAQEQYGAVQAQVATLKNDLQAALSQMYELRSQQAAQARQNEQSRERRPAPDINNEPETFRAPVPTHVLSEHVDLAVQQSLSSLRRAANQSTDSQPMHPTIDVTTGQMPRVIAPPINQTPLQSQQPSRPPSSTLSYRSSSIGPPGDYPIVPQSPASPIPANHPLTYLPRPTADTWSNERPTSQPVPQPPHAGMPRSESVLTATYLLRSTASTSRNAEGNTGSVHHPEPTNTLSEDIMDETAGPTNDADTEESEGPELPVMVDVRAVRPKRKKRPVVRGPNRSIAKGPILQRTAQREVEVIAPPAGYSRSRLSNPLLGRLRIPDSGSASNTVATANENTRISVPREVTNRFSIAQLPPRFQQSAAPQPGTHRQFRERSPTIDPPGSIFGRHNMPPSNPSLQEPISMRPARDATSNGIDPPRTASRTASATAPKETTPGRHYHDANDGRTSEIGVNVTADLVASMRALAQQMSALPYELAQQINALRGESRPQEAPYTPPRKSNRHFPFRSPARLKPRTPMRQEFLNLARPEMNQLLHLNEDNDIVHTVGRHVVPMDVLEDYEAGVGDPPTLEPLYICWDHPQTPWNLELAAKFQEYFVGKYPDFEGRDEEIQKYFIQRIQTLQKILNDRVVREGEDIQAATERVAAKWDQEERAKRRRARQRKRLNDRRETCRLAAEEDPAYDALFNVVDTLNIDGMSSDDTDGDRYSVRILPWRPPELVDVMEHLDSLHNRMTIYGNRRPGGLPHPRDRRVTQAESEREAPATLPRNLYRLSWFLGLSEFQRVRLAPGEDIIIPVVERLDR